MSSARIDNSGQFHSGGGSQWTGNSININGGNAYFNIEDSNRPAESFHLGLRFGDATPIESNLFVGRAVELQKIHDVLQPQDASTEQRRAILGGMGGVGKTQLVVAYARQHNGFYQSIFWLNATSEVSLQASLRVVAAAIEVQGVDELNDTQILGQVHRWLSKRHNSRWLLVYDNYDDPECFDIQKFFPNSAHGSIIITTRVADLMPFFGGQISIHPLTNVEESLEILSTRSGRSDIKTNPDARKLADRFAGLPLALASAGAHLRYSASISFRQYLEAYEKRWNVDPRRPLILQDYQDRTLYTTWNLSYAQLVRSDPEAAQLLQLLGYYDNQSIWFELLSTDDDTPSSATCDTSSPSLCSLQQSLKDRIHFDSTMRTLVQFCFVEVQNNTSSYSLHNCIHDWISRELNDPPVTSLYLYSVSCIARSLPKEEDLDRSEHAGLVPHAVYLTSDQSIHRSELLRSREDFRSDVIDVAKFLWYQGQRLPAEKMYLWILAELRNSMQADELTILDILHKLGMIYNEQRRSVEAERIVLQVVAGYERVLGLEDTLTINALDTLSQIYHEGDNPGAAEELLIKVLFARERVLGLEHASTLETISSLSSIYIEEDRFDEAEHVLLLAQERNITAHGPDHPLTMKSTGDLACVYLEQGRLNDAERMLVLAISGLESVVDSESSHLAFFVSRLAHLYKGQGRLDEAERLYRQTIALFERTLDPYHIDFLTTYHSLGELYQHQNRIQDAERIFLRVLAGYEMTLDPVNNWFIDVMRKLGETYIESNRFSEADKIFQRSLEACKKGLGADHEITLGIVRRIAGLYRKQGKHDEARKIEELHGL